MVGNVPNTNAMYFSLRLFRAETPGTTGGLISMGLRISPNKTIAHNILSAQPQNNTACPTRHQKLI
jgi:hypothetical protein